MSLLYINMQSHILGGLTTTVIVAAMEVPQLSLAQIMSQQNFGETLLPSASLFNPNVAVEPNAPAPAARGTDLSAWLSPSGSLVSVFPHALENRQAITLYIRSAPVITFLGAPISPLPQLETWNVGAAAITDSDLVARVATVAGRLEALLLTQQNTDQIGVRWDGAEEVYVVFMADQELMVVNQQTRLPDTTHDLARDALQVTNRLRWMLGDALPLTSIESLPEPKPEPKPEPEPQPEPEPAPEEDAEEDDWDYEEDTETAPDEPTFFGIPL